jgi:hypothetical protein
MSLREPQLTLAEVARTPASAPPRPPVPTTPPTPVHPHPRHEQLLVTVCDVCLKPLSYKGTGRYRITCAVTSCQLEHRRRRYAAAQQRSSLP